MPTLRPLAVSFALTACFFEPVVEGASSDSSGSSSSQDASSSLSASSSAVTSTTGPPSTSTTSTGDPTTGDPSGSSSSDWGSSSSSSTGDPYTDYLPCSSDDDSMCADDEDCIWTDGSTEGIEATGFCSRGCNVPGECPSPPPGSDAEVACTYYCNDVLRCMLRCPAGETCPSGTSCLGDMHLPECLGDYVDVCA